MYKEILNKDVTKESLFFFLMLLVLVLGWGIYSLTGNSQKESVSTEVSHRQILGEKLDLDYPETTDPGVQPEKDDNSEANLPVQEGAKSNDFVETRKIYLGFALDTRSQQRIDEIESQIGKKFDILSVFLQWGNPNNSSIDQNFFKVFQDNNKVPIITWEPWNPFEGINQPEYKLANIVKGNFDPYITQSAQAIKNYGKPVFLRFAHEMNGNWYPWGGLVNGNSPSDYIAAWKHVRNIFSSLGVENVTWVWSPNSWSVPYVDGNKIANYYPGDNNVDWIGLDGYNFGTSRPGSSWESFTSIFSQSYSEVVKLGNKPLMISETASSEVGGSKSSWIRSVFSDELPNKFPKISALIWFNVNKETNWDIASSSESLKSFKNSISLPIYTTTIVLSGTKIIPN